MAYKSTSKAPKGSAGVADPKDDYEKPKSNEEILAEAIAFYAEDIAYEMENREQQEIDLEFSIGRGQWDTDSIRSRSKGRIKRPMLTIDRMGEFLNHTKNEMRKNKPSIKVSPAGANSEDIQKKRIKHAQNRQGLIRQIQYDSRSSQAYQNAYDFAVDIGRGFFIVETEYVSDESFDLKIVINEIKNPDNVVIDRNRKKPDYRDMKRAFITERMPRERFKSEYPDADPSNWDASILQEYWATKDDIMIANYYCIRYKKRTLLGMEDGTNYYEDELKQFPDEDAQAIRETAVKKRKIKAPYVKCYKMTACEILQEYDILGKYIPIIPVVGVEKEVKGEVIIQGMVRKLRDPQRLYNFWASTEAELLSLAPKSPYIAADGQIKGYEKIWGEANTVPHAYLPYKPVSLDGHPVPPPQRTEFAPVPTGIVNAKMGVIDDMRAITGMHSASLGMDGPEKSGRAIIAQQAAGDTSNYHFIDNMGIAIEQAGRIINDWLLNVYDTKRIEKILGDEGEEDTIELGGEDEDGDTIELGTGEFDVVVTMGPSYTTRRQEAAESMMQFMQAVPNVVPLIYDLLVKNMDWPGAQEIADRLRKTIPPEILEKNGGEEKLAQQLQQLTMQIKQYEEILPMLSQQLEKAMAELEDNGAEISKDLEIANIKAVTDIAVAEIKAKTERHKTISNVISNATKQQSPRGA